MQARVLDLLRALQSEFGMSYLFISHDMAVVDNISDRVAVMYLGQIVEMGTRAQIFGNPAASLYPTPDRGGAGPRSQAQTRGKPASVVRGAQPAASSWPGTEARYPARYW